MVSSFHFMGRSIFPRSHLASFRNTESGARKTARRVAFQRGVAKSRIGHGSLQRSTKNFTRQHASERRSQSSSASNRNVNNSQNGNANCLTPFSTKKN